MTEDKMVGWDHQLDGHEFEQTLRVGKGQGSLACFSPWGHKESDMTERLNNSLVSPVPMGIVSPVPNLPECWLVIMNSQGRLVSPSTLDGLR